MKKGFLRRTLSLVMSTVMVSSVLFAAGTTVFADATKTAGNGWVFTQASDGLYKYTDNNGYEWIYLDQSVIDNTYGHAIPMNNQEYENYDYSFKNLYFYLDENVKVTEGAVAGWACYETIDLAGHTISYEPSDYSVPMIKNGGDHPYSNISLISTSEHPASVDSYDGATIFEISGFEGRVSHASIKNVSLAGGFGKYYSEYRNSAVVVKDNARFNMYDNSLIINFASEKGGAIRCDCQTNSEDDGMITLSKATIEGCVADEGGAIYSTHKITIAGSEKTLITKNIATTRGGGICLIGPYASLTMNDESNLEITQNKCACNSELNQGGGGIYFEKQSSGLNAKRSLVVSGTLNVNNNTTDTGTKQNFYLRYGGTECNTFYISMLSWFNGGDVGVSCGTFTDGAEIVYTNTYNNYSQSGYSKMCSAFHYDDDGYFLTTGLKSVGSMEASLILSGSSDTPLMLSGYSLLLDGSGVGIKFYVYLPDSEEVGSADNNIWTAKIGPSSGSEFYVKGTEVSTLNVDKYEKENGCATFTYYVDAADMTVPINFTLEKDGIEEFTNTGLTVRSYIDAVCNNPNKFSEADRNLAIALANYGASAQTYFNFRKTDLVNKNLDYEWEYSNDYTRFLDRYNRSLDYYGGEEGPITYYGTTMSFKGQPTLKMYFKYSSSVDTSKIRLTQEMGEEIVFIEGTQYFYVAKKNMDFYGIITGSEFGILYDRGLCISFECNTIWYLFTIITSAQGTYSDKMVDLAKAYTYFLYTCAKNQGY